MNRRSLWTIALIIFLSGLLTETVTAQTQPPKDPYAEMVITKRKWTQEERGADAAAWNSGGVQAEFYNKDDEKITTLRSPMWTRGRNPIYIWPGITRTETKLTEKEAEQGLLRYRIKIDLAPGVAGEHLFAAIKKAASVKVIYPGPKK